jgi:hypothetical protein
MGAGGSVIEESEEGTLPKDRGKNNDAKESFEDEKVFAVSLASWPSSLPKITLPHNFKLKIAYESLDFVNPENGTPIIQFPFQNIICWGSSPNNFQFKVFNLDKTGDTSKDRDALISVRTSEGRAIEDATMAMVQKLMIDINQRAITKKEFQILIDSVFEDENTLKDDWMSIIDQFTASGRLFLAKQGMELLFRIGGIAPFEKFDLACFLYDRIINKNSFQLLINTFEDEHERENLIHRLKLNKHKKEVVVDCAILREA